jgi:hypothetical protein
VGSAVDTQAEVLLQHWQIVEEAAGTVQVVVSGHYWEVVEVVVNRVALVLGL